MANEIRGNTLSYFPPDPGKAISVRIPESHCLFIGPQACGRRHCILAMECGDRKQVSFLYVTEADAVSGKYATIIGDGIERLLKLLSPTPRALLLYFNCIDDFIGTDEEALMDALRERFPNLPMECTRINPVSLGTKKVMPGMLIQSKMLSFIEPREDRDDGVNLISPGPPRRGETTLEKYLNSIGIREIRQIANRKTFDHYLEMGKSRLNLVLSPMGMIAAQDMQKKTGIPFLEAHSDFVPQKIEEFYISVAEALGKECPDSLHSLCVETEDDIRATAEMFNGMPVIVDDSVMGNTYGLAKTLLQFGFNVTSVLCGRIREWEKENAKWIRENSPSTTFSRANSYTCLLDKGNSDDYFVLGRNAAFTMNALHWVDMDPDDDYFGFAGIRLLMQKMRDSFMNGVPAKEALKL